MTWAACAADATPTDWIPNCGAGASLVRTSGSGIIYRSDDGSGDASDFTVTGSGGSITGGAGTAASPWRHAGAKDVFHYIVLKSSFFLGQTGFMQARVKEVLTGGIGNALHDHFVALGFSILNGATFVMAGRDWYRQGLENRFWLMEANVGSVETYLDTAASEESGGNEVNLGTSFDVAAKAYRAYLEEDDSTLEFTGTTVAGNGQVSIRMNYGTAGDPTGLSDVYNVMLATGDTITVNGLIEGVSVQLRDSGGNILAEETATGTSVVLDCLSVKMDEIASLGIYTALGGSLIIDTDGAEVWPGETWLATLGTDGVTTWASCAADATPTDWVGCDG